MNQLEYKNIFEYFFGEIDADPTLILLKNEDLRNLQYEYLHKAAYKPYVRRLFSILKFSDNDEILEYEMLYAADDEFDKGFICSILAKGMMIEWMSPLIRSKKNIAQMFSGKEQKFYSQANHISAISSIFENAKKEQLKLIRDRSASYNSYLL